MKVEGTEGRGGRGREMKSRKKFFVKYINIFTWSYALSEVFVFLAPLH